MRYVVFFCLLLFSLIACGKPIVDHELEPIKVEQVDPYRTARLNLFGKLHYDNGIITDVYCEEDYGAVDNVCPTCIPNPQVLNCEHTFPQSKFKGQSQEATMKVDLHHLYPVTSFANSARSNHPFGEVDGQIVCGTAKKGKIKGTNIVGFEPPNSHKGNVARAMFYFSTRYNMPLDPIQESYFRKWNKLDPVDAAERLRNRRISDIQGWTNPFIDNPNLVDSIRDF